MLFRSPPARATARVVKPAGAVGSGATAAVGSGSTPAIGAGNGSKPADLEAELDDDLDDDWEPEPVEPPNPRTPIAVPPTMDDEQIDLLDDVDEFDPAGDVR